MGIIINPRGTAGAGKTELARHILTDYGGISGVGSAALRKGGRERPIGYRLKHPLGSSPLIVIGHYERASGGCDTIRATDGGLDEISRMADAWATAGHDVLLEGSAWSAEHIRSAQLAMRHRMHVLMLSTPIDLSARNLVSRQRASTSRRLAIAPHLRAQREAIHAACSHLSGVAAVEECDFDEALSRARELLGVSNAGSVSRLPGPSHASALDQHP